MARHSPPFSASPRPSSRAFPADPSRLFAARPERWLRRMPGRETFVWPLGAGLDPQGPEAPARAIVKRSREGSRWPRVADLARRLRGARSAGRREHDNLVALAELGIAVPRALCWCEDGRGSSLVAMELVGHRESLRTRLAHVGAAERRSLADELLRLVVRLHGAGWYHRDLYLEHLLIDERPDGATRGSVQLVLIDVGRARRRPAPRLRWFVKDLAALLHSTPDAVGPRERLLFVARWLDARGEQDRARRRALVRAVLAKRARMAAHVPRHAHASSSEARR
jgi:tRNA A-37 threonylcarbamoyl transferase component Bud32